MNMHIVLKSKKEKRDNFSLGYLFMSDIPLLYLETCYTLYDGVSTNREQLNNLKLIGMFHLIKLISHDYPSLVSQIDAFREL